MSPVGWEALGQRVVWRTEAIKAAGKATGDIAVRADIEIPDRQLKMTMSLRKNRDPSLPASHTVELTFALGSGSPNGEVSNVPGILMKLNEQARGTPLAGLVVKVKSGFSLAGLSNTHADRELNLQLMKGRSWIDMPMVFANQHRAMLAIGKGASGGDAFNTAFSSWKESER
jgi:hypothetical protein